MVSGKFDSKMQLIGILLEVPSIADVRILKPAEHEPRFSAHHTNGQDPIKFLCPRRDAESSGERDTYLLSARFGGCFAERHPKACGSRPVPAFRCGSETLRLRPGFQTLTRDFSHSLMAKSRTPNIFEPIQPQPSTWRQLATWNSGDPDGHQSDLVSFEGQVVACGQGRLAG